LPEGIQVATPLTFAISRIESVLETVQQLQADEFPYANSKDALDRIQTLFKDNLTRLKALSSNPDEGLVKLQCATSLRMLFGYFPLLGFIRRSTNVRNAFELFGPLLDICGRVLEPDVDKAQRSTKLLLSSEWNYSPITYHGMRDFPGFVLIGFPASESSNPLLVPLSGHELGHAVCKKKNLEKDFRPNLQEEVLNYIKDHWTEYLGLFPNIVQDKSKLAKDKAPRDTWLRALSWAEQQAKETFCDFLGIRIYGRSFLQAFAYLSSPNVQTPRSENYPDSVKRVENLVKAAESYGFDIPQGYKTLFAPRPPGQLAPTDEFRLKAADEALNRNVDRLILKADEVIAGTDIGKPDPNEIDRICKKLRLMVPAQRCKLDFCRFCVRGPDGIEEILIA
jgi:hypothetical protein